MIKAKKYLSIIFILGLILVLFSTYSYASEFKNAQQNLIKNIDITSQEKVFDIASIVFGVAKAIAMSVAIIILVVLAIKYFSASAEGKSEVKKYAVSYIIGALLLFGGTGILTLIENAAKGFNF